MYVITITEKRWHEFTIEQGGEYMGVWREEREKGK